MKKIYVIAAIALLSLGCKKTLIENPKGQVLGSNALSTIPGLQAALTGTYKPLMEDFVSGFTSAATDAILMGSDDLTTNPGSNKQELREFDQFNVSALNSNLSQIWNGCYKSIQGSNNIISNYKQVPGDAAIINQIVGEAYFLRGFSYYWLVRLWGSVPLVTSAVYDPAILNISRSAAVDIYKQIESDLTAAQGLMQNKKTEDGRASKGAAIALLADVYLTEGGWPLNDQSKFALAASTAKSVMDNKGTYGFDLASDLPTLWAKLSSGTNISEEVFAFHSCGNCNALTSNSIFGNSSMPTEENGWDDYFCEINFFNNYPAGIRKDVTFHTQFIKPDGSVVAWQNSSTKHPYYGKFRVNGGEAIYSTSATLAMIRYAHVLLIYAEAQARSEGTVNSDSYAAVNAIRSRAGLPNLSGLSSANFINAVIDERSWEFAGETTRWFDLVRLQLLDQVNAKRNPGEIPIIGPIKYLMPIPNSDVLLNPGLGNN
ncbi:RagB/SusD family nutrient uptake outer membrane protein [Mucilaginibacter sp. SP1R1]|uniref:RagB/SusD family nutrient uptake outer membrane protein n=1 Tax=Mucilaginibacter sp. SP1R1 TaxID=2723091 RepID=UPI00161A5098|nr:RagB/SusD family nutrient uptake outer membrane protein [Mucilaginibacter sp. SP1R1]MBB6148335.1 hypothetical protein [Mucilaginibacter sp. SP1R1]